MTPVHVGELLIWTAELTLVGRTSIDVLVTVEVENLQVEAPPTVALTGYFTMVAIGPDGKPKPVPGLIPETPAEKRRYEERKKIYLQRKRTAPSAPQ